MLDETSISRKTRISSGCRATRRLAAAGPSHERSSGTGSTAMAAVARVALDGLDLDHAVGVVGQADVDRHLGVGRRGFP